MEAYKIFKFFVSTRLRFEARQQETKEKEEKEKEEKEKGAAKQPKQNQNDRNNSLFYDLTSCIFNYKSMFYYYVLGMFRLLIIVSKV